MKDSESTKADKSAAMADDAKAQFKADVSGSTHMGASDEEQEYRKRYNHCRRLMERREPFRSMSDEEKDGLARKLSASEYLDLTSDWAFKYLFHGHPNLLIILLNDILQESVVSITFQNHELVDLRPEDKKVVFDLLCRTDDDRTFLCEMQKTTRSYQRDRLFYYGSRLVARQMKSGDRKYVLSPVKVVCIMNYEDSHPGSPDEKILYQYRTQEIETGEPFGDQMTFHLLELPRIMRYAEEYESPVAGWCRIFRNFSIFARTAAAKGSWFSELEGAMRIRGLSDKQMDSYFSDMITKEDMLPYLEGSEQQGYRRGLLDGLEQGRDRWLAEGKAEGKSEGRSMALADVARSLLAMGLPVEQIVTATGLSAEQVKALKP